MPPVKLNKMVNLAPMDTFIVSGRYFLYLVAETMTLLSYTIIYTALSP